MAEREVESGRKARRLCCSQNGGFPQGLPQQIQETSQGHTLKPSASVNKPAIPPSKFERYVDRAGDATIERVELVIFHCTIPDCLRIWRSTISRSAATLPAALATMASDSRSRPAASSSIAVRKQAMARSAVWASGVGCMVLLHF